MESRGGNHNSVQFTDEIDEDYEENNDDKGEIDHIMEDQTFEGR